MEDRGTYLLSLSPQGSVKWKEERYGSISSSTISECVGRSFFSPKTEEEKIRLGRVLCGLEEKEFSEDSIIHMRRGTNMEPKIREWHFGEIRKEFGANIRLEELGLAIWKKDPRFRGSVDAEIGDDGCAEYKCPQSMYKPLIQYVEAVEKGYNVNTDNYIYKSHKDQMTLNSIILNKKWCDYCVISPDGKCFYQRILTDYDLWENILYPEGVKFYEKYMKMYTADFSL